MNLNILAICAVVLLLDMFPFFVLIIFYEFSARAKIVALLCGQPQDVFFYRFSHCFGVFVSILDFLFAPSPAVLFGPVFFFVVRSGPNF